MKDDKLYLIHILESIDKIDSYTSGLDFTAFLGKSIVQDAVLRNLQVLAESTQRLSGTFKSSHTDIEWYKIAGLRNILVPYSRKPVIKNKKTGNSIEIKDLK